MTTPSAPAAFDPPLSANTRDCTKRYTNCWRWRWAPSGTNVQPWRTYVLAGKEKDALAQAIIAKYRSSGEESKDFEYYPREWLEPWISRRRKVGADLYGLLEITKGDKEKMLAQWTRNYLFFDAPVGLIFTIDASLARGCCSTTACSWKT